MPIRDAHLLALVGQTCLTGMLSRAGQMTLGRSRASARRPPDGSGPFAARTKTGIFPEY
jgi:hypothetical protein